MAVGRRLVMALVGVLVFAVYAAAAALAYWVLAGVVRADVSLASTLAIVVVATVVFAYASYRFGTRRVLQELDARPLARGSSPAAYDRLDRLTDRMDVGTPTIYVARMPMPNAISLGGPGDGAIVFDRALFRILTPVEFEGVLAHELAHLESRDSLVQTVAYSLSRTVVSLLAVVLLPVTLLAAGVSRLLAWLRGQPFESSGFDVHQRIGALVLAVFLALTLLVRAHSRSREFAADERAVEVTGRPGALAAALRKIERASEPAGGILSPLYVHTDETDDERWFSTHPSMEERIDRIRELTE
ncbi:M48 family metallopeptidase [Salarchaeum japonicum]|nr:M48 family metalloprotease [Salarchaeum japonicum]